MNDRSAPDLSQRIYSIVREYANRKTEARCGLTWDSFKDSKNAKGQVNVPSDYREAREKVCSSAFLAARSRKSREDFAAFFTGTICAVPQFLREKDFEAVSAALTGEHWEDVRTLTMLALSGLSRT